MWSRRENGKIGQAANTKGYSSSAVTCRVPCGSGLHVPDRIVGIKAARGSIWDLPAERDRHARALLLLTIPLLSSSSLTWQLGRGEALEGKICMLKNGVWAVPRDSAPVHQILVHPCVSQ